MSETTRGEAVLAVAAARLGVDFGALVAGASIWVSREVFDILAARDPDALWFPRTRRARIGRGEKRRDVLDGVTLDDNHKANRAIKEAIFDRPDACVGFACCHVWPESCYDARAHTCLANLVLLPAPLASLTDHDPHVGACLRRRAFELFGWRPAGLSEPETPTNYPGEALWLPSPAPSPRVIERARRKASGVIPDV